MSWFGRGHIELRAASAAAQGGSSFSDISAAAYSLLDLPLDVPMMMSRCRWCGCRNAVKRVNTTWLGDTVAMMHYLRIVNSRSNQ